MNMYFEKNEHDFSVVDLVIKITDEQFDKLYHKFIEQYQDGFCIGDFCEDWGIVNHHDFTFVIDKQTQELRINVDATLAEPLDYTSEEISEDNWINYIRPAKFIMNEINR